MILRIAENCPEKEAYQWIWEVFAQYCGVAFQWDNPTDSEAIVLGEVGGTHPLSYNSSFWDAINRGAFEHETLLNEAHRVVDEKGKEDLLMTAFYFINCLFERSEQVERDEIGRLEYSKSIWKARDLSIKTPFVHHLFDELAKQLELKVKPRKTVAWLSHDIDVIYGGWLQDGKWLIKQRKPFRFVQLALGHFFKKPQWLNLTEIAKKEREKGAQSTFFLLTEKGRIDQRKVNADYLLTDKAVQREIAELKELGNEIGLHKSLNSTSYAEEAKKIGEVKENRNHYLAIAWPNDLWKQHEAGIDFDASLGYAEDFGFKNGYALPFYPFDLDKRQVIPVLEVPLNLMDGTFSAYLKMSPSQAKESILNYICANKNNAVISVLWHNSHFTDFKYRGFPSVYWELIDALQQQDIEIVSMKTLKSSFPKSIHRQLK